MDDERRWIRTRSALRRGLAILLLIGTWSATAWAQQPAPVGSEFQVNTYTTNSQLSPSVALDADGDFVVVWQSRGSGGTDSSEYSIQGQRYASDGSTVGGEFQVNTYTTYSQAGPSVALDADGDFVVVWNSAGSDDTDSDGASIQGQRYAGIFAARIFADGFESGDTTAWSPVASQRSRRLGV